jgi:hypothetical protein
VAEPTCLGAQVQVCFDTLRASVEASVACGAITIAASVREYAPIRAAPLQHLSANLHSSATGKSVTRGGGSPPGSGANSALLSRKAWVLPMRDTVMEGRPRAESAAAVYHLTQLSDSRMRCVAVLCTVGLGGSQAGPAEEAGMASDGAIPIPESLAVPSWSLPGVSRVHML